MLAPGHDGALTQGTVGEGMACLRVGAGPPLVFLPGLSARHRLPRGMDRWLQLQQIRPFAGGRQVWWIQRRAGLAAPVTMTDLAAGRPDRGRRSRARSRSARWLARPWPVGA